MAIRIRSRAHFWVGLVFSLFGAGVLGSGIWYGAHRQDILATGHAVAARVTAAWVEVADNGESISRIAYAFTAADGQKVEGDVAVGADLYANLVADKSVVEIVYRREDPSDLVLTGAVDNDRPSVIALTGVMVMVIGLGLLAFGLVRV